MCFVRLYVADMLSECAAKNGLFCGYFPMQKRLKMLLRISWLGMSPMMAERWAMA